MNRFIEHPSNYSHFSPAIRRAIRLNWGYNEEPYVSHTHCHTQCHTEEIALEKVKKTFRLEKSAVLQLEGAASAEGKTATEIVEKAIALYAIRGKDSDESGRENGNRNADCDGVKEQPHDEISSELLRQLAVKDEQISKLADALLNAQESAKAAQVLHAADVAPRTFEGGERSEKRKTRWRRLTEAWRG